MHRLAPLEILLREVIKKIFLTGLAQIKTAKLAQIPTISALICLFSSVPICENRMFFNGPILEIIKRRDSVRDYLDRAVEREKIMLCLEAARLAPSACNAQPWKFIVVDEPDLKNRLCEVAFRGIYKMNAFVKKAPVVIVVVSQKEKFFAKVGNYLRNTHYYLIDLGIAGEHLILQASELGLGTCWIGWFNERQVKKILNIPKNKKVDILISLGYSKEAKLKDKERHSLEEISSFNRY